MSGTRTITVDCGRKEIRMARLVHWVNGEFIKEELPLGNLRAAMEVRGYSFAGATPSGSTRQELWYRPVFAGLVGPMWDGDAIRYESVEIAQEVSR